MTISADYAPNIDLGNGGTKTFAINFPFGAPGDILVSLFNTANIAQSPSPALNGATAYDYTVAGTPDSNTGIYPNGSITFNTAPPGGYSVVRERATAQRQNSSFTSNGPFPAKTVEGALDRGEMQIQESLGWLRRALKLSAIDALAAGQLPALAGNAGKVLAVNSTATGFTLSDPMVTQALAAAATATAAAAALSGAAGMWSRPVIDRLKAPPTVTPTVGDRYLVHRLGTAGVFIGHEDNVAEWGAAGAWQYSGPPQAGQVMSMHDVLYEYRLGVEEEVVAGTYFWRPLNTGTVEICEGATLYSFGDSITIVQTTNSWPARFAANWGIALVNDGISGTGFWSATWHSFARPTLDRRLGNALYSYAIGHNNALATSTLQRATLKAYHETFAMLCHAFGSFQSATSLTPAVGTWATDAGAALGLKDLSSQSGVGNVMYTPTPGLQLNGSFSGENFILHTFRGDGVGANRCSDITIIIDGSTRASYVDDGLWETNTDLSDMGHAIYIDNKWGTGTHNFTIQAGGNASAGRPCYVDGVTTLRAPELCNPVLIHMPMRPTDLQPTTSLSGATATDANFRAVETGIKQALAYFQGYPAQIVYSNDWLDSPVDFSDLEHPSGAGTIKLVRAVSSQCRKGSFNASSTYTPATSGLVNVASVTGASASFVVNGKSVTVSVELSVTATANNADTAIELALAPGFPSNFSASGDCEGVLSASSGVQQSAAIRTNTANKTAWMLWRNTAGTGAVVLAGTFTYRIK